MSERKKNRVDFSSMEFGKIPPQAVKLEESVLGALMSQPKLIYEVSGILKPEHFYKEIHQIIYSACLKIFHKGQTVDEILVMQTLHSSEQLLLIGGPYILTQLTGAVSETTNTLIHSRIIFQKFVARELIRVGSETVAKAYEDSADEFELLQAASATFYQINHEFENSVSISSEKIVLDFYDNRQKFLTDSSSRLYTGFPDWDSINGPLFRGGVYVLAGRPGAGKTAFVVEMVRRMASHIQIGFINLEMTTDQMVKRFISNSQNLDNREFKNHNTPDWVNEKINAGAQEFLDLKMNMESASSMTVEAIVAKIKYWKYKNNMQVLIIDYLQRIKFTEEREKYHSKLENVEYTMDMIVQAAKDENIPIFLLCQLNRDVLKRGGTMEPQTSDLKDAGRIEEVAYQIMFLHRPEYYDILEDENGESTKGLAYGLIKKHRDGVIGKVKFRFQGQFSKFSDWDVPMISNISELPF